MMQNTDKLNIGLIGLGFMGRVHTENLKKTANVLVTALCGASSDEGEFFKAELGLAEAIVYPSYESLLSEGIFDALVVCIPPYLSRNILLACAKSGVPVFHEKPMSLNFDESMSIAEAFSGRIEDYQIGFHYRYSPFIQEIQRLNEDLGNLLMVRGTYFCNSLHAPWWRQKNLSGGQLNEQAIHLVDLVHLFAGSAIRVQGKDRKSEP